ncbi:hypothetical protein CLOP_g9656 [Closterium sp. NIES-67]|nr:hypothetical protein CLOP_g9656 [Closterium sp. NIES-67]
MTTFRPVEELLAEYEMHEELGTGKFGMIRRCTHRATGKDFACKRVSGQPDALRAAANEIRALSVMAGCRHVISFHAVFRNPKSNALYMIMDLATNGDLLGLVQEHGVLPEWEARQLFRGLAEGVKECHDRNVMHRDIKPDNVLLFPRTAASDDAAASPLQEAPKSLYNPPQSPSSNTPCWISQAYATGDPTQYDFAGPSNPPSPTGPLSPNVPPSPRQPGQDRFVLPQADARETELVAKLADFGSSVVVKQWQRTQGFVGSVPYAAPEVLAGKNYSFSADVWSLGATLFAMLSGSWPTVINGRHSSKDWEMACWMSVSYRAKTLIGRMLFADTNRRPTIDEVLADPWLCSCPTQRLSFREEARLAAMALGVSSSSTTTNASGGGSSHQSQGHTAARMMLPLPQPRSTLASRLLPQRWLRTHDLQ